MAKNPAWASQRIPGQRKNRAGKTVSSSASGAAHHSAAPTSYSRPQAKAATRLASKVTTSRALMSSVTRIAKEIARNTAIKSATARKRPLNAFCTTTPTRCRSAGQGKRDILQTLKCNREFAIATAHSAQETRSAIFVVRPRGGRRQSPAMAAAKKFIFICGSDDYLVGRMGKERFEKLVAGAGANEFSQETVNGFAANVAEVETAVNRFRESVQTISMFGGKRDVWLKDVNFLADTVTGRAESTLKLVEDLQQILESENPEETGVLVTAAPIDRRRSFPKWCEKNADFSLIGGDSDS